MVYTLASVLSLLGKWPAIFLHPLRHMLKNDVELRGDWEGGGGVEGEESCPQLGDKKPPVGVQFEPKETLIELLDLEEHIKVQAPDGVTLYQGHQLFQVGEHFPNLGPLVISLLPLVAVGLDAKKIIENCLNFRPGGPLKVIDEVVGGKEKMESTWGTFVQYRGIKSISHTFNQNVPSHTLEFSGELCFLNSLPQVQPACIVHVQTTKGAQPNLGILPSWHSTNFPPL